MGGVAEGGFDQPGGSPRFYRHTNRLFVLLVFVFFPFVFGACSSERQGDEARSLEERVRGFWEARITGDDIKAYNYEAYSKTGKMTLPQYLRARNPALKYLAYEVKGTVEKGDEATVTVDVQYHLVVPARADLDLSTTIDERWVRIDGQWYRQVEDSNANLSSG